jgi:hypothetical protein
MLTFIFFDVLSGNLGALFPFLPQGSTTRKLPPVSSHNLYHLITSFR